MKINYCTSGPRVQNNAILLSNINRFLTTSWHRADSLIVKREESLLDSPKENQKAEQGGIMLAQTCANEIADTDKNPAAEEIISKHTGKQYETKIIDNVCWKMTAVGVLHW